MECVSHLKKSIWKKFKKVEEAVLQKQYLQKTHEKGIRTLKDSKTSTLRQTDQIICCQSKLNAF